MFRVINKHFHVNKVVGGGGRNDLACQPRDVMVANIGHHVSPNKRIITTTYNYVSIDLRGNKNCVTVISNCSCGLTFIRSFTCDTNGLPNWRHK